MYTGPHCPYCNMAKQLLKTLGVESINEIHIADSDELFEEMQQRTGRRTVPQIFIGETHVGGFTDLQALHQKHELVGLLNGEKA